MKSIKIKLDPMNNLKEISQLFLKTRIGYQFLVIQISLKNLKKMKWIL